MSVRCQRRPAITSAGDVLEGCVDAAVICCRTAKNPAACMLVQDGHVGRGALMHQRDRAIGATAVPLRIPCHFVFETCST